MSKKARPWDLISMAMPGTNIEKVPVEIHDKRLSICRSCPNFIQLTGQCGICHCFMNPKSWLPHAECALPEGERKWEKYEPIP